MTASTTTTPAKTPAKKASAAKATAKAPAKAAPAAKATGTTASTTATAQTAAKGSTAAKRSSKATKASPAKVVSTDLAADLATGNVRLFRVRGNGTTRRIPYLAPASTPRKKAEQVKAMRDGGKTMRQIAEELHESLATVRRELTHLALAQAVEAGADPTTLGYRIERKAEAKAS